MKPRNRHELEAMSGVALLIFVLLALAPLALYEGGYLGTAVAVLGGVAVCVGLMRVFRARVAPGKPVSQRRYQEEEWGGWLPSEQEVRLPPEYEEWSVQSVAQEGREEAERSKELLKEQEQPIELSKRDTTIQALNEISDREFEQLVEYYLRSYGYVVETTLPSGGRGADLLITASDRRISILLKLQDEPVGDRAVQEALGGRAFYGTYEAWLITNNTFTRGTLYEAKRKGVHLIDGEGLVEWLEKLSDQSEDMPR